MKTEFTKSELASLTARDERKTTQQARRLLDWTTRGYLVPYRKAEGQGKISYYDLSNAIEAMVLDRVSSRGIMLSRFSEIFNGGEVKDQLKGCADYLFFKDADGGDLEFQDMLLSLVVVNDCGSVFIERTATSEELKLKMRNGDDAPTVNNFWKTVVIINLNEILAFLRKRLKSV